MDWPYLDNKIYKVMEKLSAINDEEYEDRFYNPRPYPGWCPELKHYMWGFIKGLKEKEAAGYQLKIDAQSLSELFDVIIRISDTMEDKMKEGTERLGNSATKFNYLLLNKLYKPEEENGEVKNVFISSGRLQAVLSLLSNWVGWYKREEIMKAICCEGVDVDEANEMFCDERFLMPYKTRCESSKEQDTIIDLNTFMWIQKGLKPDRRGLIDTEKAFNVKFSNLDFKDKKKAQTVISEQIERSSHGLLKNVQIPIKKETNAILADILYFKAIWEKQFDEYFSRTRNFYYHGGVSKVKMMKQTEDFLYYENDFLQSVVLPYTTNSRTRSFSMWIHLPKKGHNIAEALDYISNNMIGSQYEMKEVEITLPKFEIEARTSLKDILMELGMKELFNDDDAIPNLLRDTKLDDIIQQGKMKIDEQGTEASMATIISCEAGCAPMERPKPIEMKVNHEFIFEIVETYSGQRYFSGIVNKL